MCEIFLKIFSQIVPYSGEVRRNDDFDGIVRYDDDSPGEIYLDNYASQRY